MQDLPWASRSRVLLSIKETAEFVKIPINGLSTSQRKLDREPDEVVRMLRALRNANSFLQNQREISPGLVEKLLKLDRPVAKRFYALYREQFNPDLKVPDAVSNNGFPWGRLEQKKKSPPSRNRSSIGRLPKELDADH